MDKNDKIIIAAIVTGIFVILAAIINIIPFIDKTPTPTEPNITVVDVATFNKYGPRFNLTGVDATYSESLGICHTYLDFKIKNTGDEIAIIKSVDIEVLDSAVDYTPRLAYTRDFEPNKISLLIENFGWGAAKNVTFKDFQGNNTDLLISVLDLDRNSFLWQGDINEGSKVEIEHLYKENLTINYFVPPEEWQYPGGPELEYSSEEILKGSAFWDSIYGKIEYYDIYGNYYASNFVGFEEIAIKNNHLYIISGVFAPIPPSAEYNAVLSSESKTPYTIKVPVSHGLPPNTADRFLIELDSDKAATYDIIAYVNYDSKAEETNRIQLKIEKLNEVK